jgi:hypothetical protein
MVLPTIGLITLDDVRKEMGIEGTVYLSDVVLGNRAEVRPMGAPNAASAMDRDGAGSSRASTRLSGAYSMRLVVPTYTGPLVQVRTRLAASSTPSPTTRGPDSLNG